MEYKIVNNQKSVYNLYFNDLQAGDVFQIADAVATHPNHLYIKLDACYVPYAVRHNEFAEQYNAMHLSNADMIYIAKETRVTKLNKPLEIDINDFIDYKEG